MAYNEIHVHLQFPMRLKMSGEAKQQMVLKSIPQTDLRSIKTFYSGFDPETGYQKLQVRSFKA
jgi:hypothetical protein